MTIEQNEFFKQMTMRICGSLDLQKALEESYDYLKKVMPMNLMSLDIYDSERNTLEALANVTDMESYKHLRFLALPEKLRGKISQRWANIEGTEIINRPAEHPVASAFLKEFKADIDVSILQLSLKIESNLSCVLTCIAKGVDSFTKTHARLLDGLHDPFAVAMANALKHKEVLRYKDMLADDNRYLQKELRDAAGSEVIGADFGLRQVMDMARQVAVMDSPVMLLGETGVGKEVISSTIHDMSPRADGPFIRVNCGAIPDNLIDSELFGHEKGSFTGAIDRKRGRFERADGGTIFLDEIGELPLQAQVRLLSVIQNREIERVGGTRTIPVNVRILSATHRNLSEMVAKQQFREDLWFRINVFPITIPPLRHRKEDIPALALYFIGQKSRYLKLNFDAVLAPGAMDRLIAHEWTGNVRELQNIIERELIQCRDGRLTFETLLQPAGTGESFMAPPPSMLDTVLSFDEHIRQHVERVLKITKGKINGPGGAAELLKINPNTLRKRMKKLNIGFGRMRK
jgi:transcriptional regulator with GAF, ATPase, and Fis domain